MARLIPITPLPSFPWARSVHSLHKRSSLPISVLFFLCALPSVTSHPVKNDLQVFHLLKPLSLTSSPYREKMDWIMNPNPSAKPITKGAQLTLPCHPPANCKVLWLVRQKLCNSGDIPQATLCARPSHTSKSCPNHSAWELGQRCSSFYPAPLLWSCVYWDQHLLGSFGWSCPWAQRSGVRREAVKAAEACLLSHLKLIARTAWLFSLSS